MAQYKIIDGIAVFGELSDRAAPDVAANSDVFQQIKSAAAPEGTLAALSADNHLGYRMPIGGIVAYRDHISPSGVGNDIGCGNNAVKTPIKKGEIEGDVMGILRAIKDVVRFGPGSTGGGHDHPVMHSPLWKNDLASRQKSLAAEQLGSVGGGNHFVDLLEDEDGFVWVANHFGSRGLGFSIAKTVLGEMGVRDSVFGPPALLKAGAPLFDEYLEAMRLAGEYAQAGREIVISQVLQVLGVPAVSETVSNHHNFAWRETLDGQDYWVIRKGATPLRPGQTSFIGGSMGDISVIVRGLDSNVAQLALYSAPHGAGRTLSRNKAKQAITREQMDERLLRMGVTLIGGDIDESPQAYRQLSGVLDAHSSGFEIMHVLRPFGVLMAGKDEYDPYKD